jgi:hypothetical protein
MTSSGQRPVLTSSTPVDKFLDYYWLKQELVDFCRLHQLKATGSKMEITGRIAQWLQTGQVPLEPAVWKSRVSPPLLVAMDALITENYSSGDYVRAFFKSVIGPHFRFTVGLMKYCKENPTKTYGDGCPFGQMNTSAKAISYIALR